MNKYEENKIFVEGESDKRFLDFILLNHFEINDNQLVVEVGGKDKLEKHKELLNTKRRVAKAKNILIFDTDYTGNASNGGRIARLNEYQEIARRLEVTFEIFLLPFNDEREGILEDLLNTCLNNKFSFFDECWAGMIECIKNNEIDRINLPAQKAFIFSKIDLFRDYRKGSWNYKASTKYDYSDDDIWNLEIEENENLKNLINFLKENLFN